MEVINPKGGNIVGLAWSIILPTRRRRTGKLEYMGPIIQYFNKRETYHHTRG